MAIPFGLSASSSTAQSSPFYNQNAGIFFNSSPGDIENAPVSANAVSAATPSRQTAGESSPLAFGESGGVNPLYVVAGIGAAIALGFIGWFAFKK